MTPPPDHPPTNGPHASVGTVALLTSLVMLAQLATSLYLPSLPSLAEAFDVEAGEVKLTMTVFLAAFALAQLVYGPISDRYGRRPVLAIGILIYIVGSAICGFATSLTTLIVGRIIQGAGACAGPAIARAVVRDRFGRVESARVLAYIGMAMAVSPALGPIIGGKLQVWFGWQACFAVLFAFGLAVLFVSRLRLIESLKTPDPSATAPVRLIRNYATLLANPGFLVYTLIVGCFFGGLFAFATGLPFVFIELAGMSPDDFGAVFIITVVGYLSGSVVTSRISHRIAGERLVFGGTAIQFAAGATLLALVIGGNLSVPAIMLPIMVYMFGFAVALPHAQVGAMAPFPMMAGAASALLGFSQMGMASIGAAGVAIFYNETPVPMAAVLFAMAFVAMLACLLLWRVRHEPD